MGEGLLGGIHDASSEVSDKTEGFWAKHTKGLHCYGHEVVTGLQMDVLGFLPPLGLACHCPTSLAATALYIGGGQGVRAGNIPILTLYPPSKAQWMASCHLTYIDLLDQDGKGSLQIQGISG